MRHPNLGRLRAILAPFAGGVLLASGVYACSSSSTPKSSARDAGGVPDSAATDAGGLYLSELSVSMMTADGASVPSLVPAFSPSVHDYYVRCGAGANELNVSMTASAGANSVLVEPTMSAAKPQQSLSVQVNEADPLVAAATRGGVSAEYWVRCLPHDFPVITLTSHPNAGAPPPGYYLVGVAGTSPGRSAYAMALDTNGVPVWFAAGGDSVSDVDSIQTGVISFRNAPRPFANYALAPPVTTYVTAEGASTDEHELQRLPNGHFMVIDSPVVTDFDLTGLTLPTADGGVYAFGARSNIRDCLVREVDPSGSIVWEWHAVDHFDPVADMTYKYPVGETINSEPLVEPFHCNSLDIDSLGNVLVSSRHMNAIFYIERATGKVLWKMGGATASKDNATYVSVADTFYCQHDARFQADWTPTCNGKAGSGRISIFDDESFQAGSARGVVYQVSINGDGCGDAATSSATVTWQYHGNVSVEAMGSFRVLPEGGAIVGWGTTAGFIFTETNPQGIDLLDVHFDHGNTSYRAIKVPLAQLDLGLLRNAVEGSRTIIFDAGAKAMPLDSGSDDSGPHDATSSP